jgi:acyl-CoA thioesterase
MSALRRRAPGVQGCIGSRLIILSTERSVNIARGDPQPMPSQSSTRPRLATVPETPQEVAEYVRDGMLANDRATLALGMRILEIGPGSATLSMAVREDMLNGHDICHGGFMATLADSSFAFACNSYNELTVASGFAVDFLAPARLGDVLTARCTEVSKTGRTGVYDVELRNQRGDRVAVFRGRSHTIRGKPAVAG